MSADPYADCVAVVLAEPRSPDALAIVMCIAGMWDLERYPYALDSEPLRDMPPHIDALIRRAQEHRDRHGVTGELLEAVACLMHNWPELAASE